MTSANIRDIISYVTTRRLSAASNYSAPWLSESVNPLLHWTFPRNSARVTRAPNLISNAVIAGETKQTKDVRVDEEDETLLAKISRIVRNNGDDMESALQSSGVQISPPLMEKLLEKADCSWKPIFRCFSWAGRQTGFTHTSRACNMMINIMTKMREFDCAWDLVGQMKEQTLINLETFAILMRRYARAGNPELALRTFDSMENFGLICDSEAFNVLLNALCKEGRVGTAALFFKQRRSVVECSIVTYNILINGWCKAGRFQKAHKLFDEMVSHGILPSVVTYTTLIDGYCRVGKLEDALKLLDAMKDKGCIPNVITYNSVVDALAEAGRANDALLMLDEMGAADCMPNISTYNSLVKGLCKQEDLPGASRVLQMMMERGCLPTTTTYNYFFRVFSKHGRIKEGMNLYMKMLGSGYVPERLTYNLLIKMLCERKRVELALQVKKDMEGRGCDPDLAIWTMLIHRLCRSNKLDEAYEHFEEMIQKGISPQYVTYEMLVERLKKSGQSDKCKWLVKMMAVTPHSKQLPNTYRRDMTQDGRTKAIISEAQKISRRLMSRGDSKQLPIAVRPNSYQKQVNNRRLVSEIMSETSSSKRLQNTYGRDSIQDHHTINKTNKSREIS